MSQDERELSELDVPDEPEPSTDDVDGDAVEDDGEGWIDTPSGAPAH